MSECFIFYQDFPCRLRLHYARVTTNHWLLDIAYNSDKEEYFVYAALINVPINKP